jgi:hypothetical protein
VTLDAKQSIIAWVSVTAYVGLFALLMYLDVSSYVPSWFVPLAQGLLISSLVVQLLRWLRKRRKDARPNG